jgi:preprotein translocase subunit SecF
MEIFSSKLNFDFMRMGKYAIVLSLLVIGASIYQWIILDDSAKYGVDYMGGYEILVKVSDDLGSEDLRAALRKSEFSDFVVQSFEAESKEYSIRLGAEGLDSATVRAEIDRALKQESSGEVEILATNYIGPTIGKELRRQALIAIIIGLFGILGYITYRFELAFALGAVAALFHDVIVCVGVYLFMKHSLNMASLAACLTIVGYSVNDTIIVFDRMREEIFKRKEFDLIELMNFSINATLSRTIITSLLTLFAAVSLLVFGGGAIQDLSLLLVVGVITGTYSTIFIASPIAYLWERFRTPVGAEQ